MKYLNSLLSASLAVVIAGSAHAAAPARTSPGWART